MTEGERHEDEEPVYEVLVRQAHPMTEAHFEALRDQIERLNTAQKERHLVAMDCLSHIEEALPESLGQLDLAALTGIQQELSRIEKELHRRVGQLEADCDHRLDQLQRAVERLDG